MASPKGRNALLPKLRTPPPAGGMSAPRLEPWTLVARRSQVWVADRWRTVTRLLPCQMEPVHGPMCTRFVLDEEPAATHADIRFEVWVRHPVGGGS